MGIRAAHVPLLFVLVAVGGCGDDEPEPTTDPTSAQTSDGGGDLDAVSAEVEQVAPALESLYRGGTYPTNLQEALASLDGADIELASGHSLATYVYDADAVEFTICIEDDGGAWAAYDTAPMSVRDGGESGGCPR